MDNDLLHAHGDLVHYESVQELTNPRTVVVGELGVLRLWVDGTEQQVRGARTRAVLALLALRGASGASMDYLVDTVWPDQPPSARRSLANVVRKLRGVMGADSIVTQGSIYRLGDHVDSQRERFLQASNRVASPECEPDEAGQLVAAVDTLWRGEPWADFDDETPLISDRVKLHEARLRLFEAAAAAALSSHKAEAAARYLRELVKQRPHQEHWWRDLASSVAAGGDRVAALRLLQTARSALDQVGLAPSRELVELEQRFLGVQDRGSGGQGNGPHFERFANPSLRVAEDLPFVGRVDQISQLVTPSGEGHVPSFAAVYIEGPAGSGKSRLAIESARRCHSHVVLCGRCEEAGWATLGPIQQILEECLAAASADDATADLAGFESVLAEHMPSIEADRPSGSTAPSLVEERERLVLACISVLTRACEREPHLLLIDDLQWGSDLVLDVIEGLAHRADANRLAIMVTCRFDGARTANQARVTRLLAMPDSLHLLMQPLLHEDVQAIVASTGSEADAEDLLRRTGGNPFFLAELLRTGPGQVDDATLSRVVRSRVHLVHAEAARFLTVAALRGLDFDPWLVGEVLQLGPAITSQLLDVLANHQLVLRRENEPNRCTFAHGLVAEAMVSSADVHERRRLHLDIANTEQSAGSPIDTWIEHLLEAGPLVERHELAGRSVDAATRLVHNGRPEAAVSVMRRVLAGRLDVSDRVAALATLAGAMQHSGEAGSEAVLLEASELAIEEELDAAFIDVALVYSRGGPWRRNNDTNGERLLRLALDRCPADQPELRTRIETRLVCFSIFSGSLKDRSTAAETAIALARQSGDTEALAEATNAAILAVTCPVALTRTRELEDEMLRLEDAGLARSEMSNRPAISTYWSGDGDQYRSDVLWRQANQVSATRSERSVLSNLVTVLALVEGRLDDARDQLDVVDLDSDVAKGNYAWNTTTTEWLAGDVAKALPLVRRTYEEFRGAPLRYTLLWLAVEAEDSALVDELYSTITPVRIARLPELYLGGFGLAGLAMAAYKLEDRELAAIVEPELGLLSNQMIGVPWSSFPAADFFLALLAKVQGHSHLAEERAAAAALVHARMGASAYDELLERYLPAS